MTILIIGNTTSRLNDKDAVKEEGNIAMIQLLGVQKGGSSSMYEFLVQHPLLCGGRHKEPHFFDHLNVNITPPSSSKARLEYMNLFPTVKKCNLVAGARYIDGSTVFGRMEKNARNMFQFFSSDERNSLKFIVLLREPVSRDYSWYEQVIRDKLIAGVLLEDLTTFKEYDTKGLSSTITHVHRSGMYVEQLKQFLKYFRRDQILVLSSSAIFHNSSAMMGSIAGFLDIEKAPVWSGPFPHDDHLESFQKILECIKTYTPKLDCSFKEELASFYKPLNEQ
jgi:hypothetical protein